MTTTQPSIPLGRAGAEDHPLVDDVNALHQDRLSPTEKICRRIADATGAPTALLLAIIVQIIWIGIGALTHSAPALDIGLDYLS